MTWLEMLGQRKMMPPSDRQNNSDLILRAWRRKDVSDLGFVLRIKETQHFIMETCWKEVDDFSFVF